MTTRTPLRMLDSSVSDWENTKVFAARCGITRSQLLKAQQNGAALPGVRWEEFATKGGRTIVLYDPHAWLLWEYERDREQDPYKAVA